MTSGGSARREAPRDRFVSSNSLRFVLDHDVDARVVALLRKSGHECWTVGDAGLALASDDDVSVYCDNQKAVLITHDVDLV